MNASLRNERVWSMTNGLIVLYVLVFIAEEIYGVRNATLDFALNAPAVLQGHQYWRIWTSAFLHGDILHLLMNCYFIYIVGYGVESMLGKWRYAFLVIVTIMTSSAVVLAWDWQTGTMAFTLGSSGFAFGLVGFLAGFAIMYPQRYYGNYLKNLLFNIGFYTVLFLLLGVNVSWEGHIGGFVGGLLVALMMNTFFRRQEW